MVLIANPIYDSVFKFLMEDQKVAKLLLSALLKKEIVELEMKQHEYTAMEQTRISLFRLDFAAKVREEDGTEQLVLIELQKTWLITETLRFRQYLGTQYLNKSNMVEGRDKRGKRESYGLPIVSIYILGHALGDLTEPVIYVRRNYLDYENNPLPQPDKFIESLTHDSIIVQIPFLPGRTRNRLERMLEVFNQELCQPKDEHYLVIEEEKMEGEAKLLVNRLMQAAVAPDIRRSMEVEDEILSEIEDRDTTIMLKDQEIEQKEQVIEQKEQVIEQKEQEIEQKEQEIEQKEQMIEQKEQEIEQKDLKIEQLEQGQELLMQSMVKMLHLNGISVAQIAEQLALPLEQIEKYLEGKHKK